MTPLPVSKWHARWFETLEHVRGVRCTPDSLPSSMYLPLLAFYMDHSLLVLNAQAMRELARSDDETSSPAIRAAHKKTVKVATRMLKVVMTDPILNDLRLGFHNNQFIMICHAAAEVVQVCPTLATHLKPSLSRTIEGSLSFLQTEFSNMLWSLGCQEEYPITPGGHRSRLAGASNSTTPGQNCPAAPYFVDSPAICEPFSVLGASAQQERCGCGRTERICCQPSRHFVHRMVAQGGVCRCCYTP